MSSVPWAALAFWCALGAWTTGLGGSHWLVVALRFCATLRSGVMTRVQNCVKTESGKDHGDGGLIGMFKSTIDRPLFVLA